MLIYAQPTWALTREWALTIRLGKTVTWVLTREWALAWETTVIHTSYYLDYKGIIYTYIHKSSRSHLSHEFIQGYYGLVLVCHIYIMQFTYTSADFFYSHTSCHSTVV